MKRQVAQAWSDGVSPECACAEVNTPDARKARRTSPARHRVRSEREVKRRIFDAGA